MRRVFGTAIVLALVAAVTSVASAKVLRVGTYKGVRGQFSSIQAAVDAAHPGDWVLVGPGDYKEHSGRAPKGRPDLVSGVLVTTPRLYIRGMNRNSVVVDGTKPGAARCSSKASAQEFGPKGLKKGAKRRGLNGLLVWKANNVWIQNLTACNYLHGSGDTGNAIWWNGGNDTANGGIGGHGMVGSYLNTTVTYFKGEETAAQYGIFSSNWDGGLWDHTYASNFNDSGYYIGACKQQCNQVVDHAHAQFNVLGYSGSNSGGSLVVKRSEFDNNQDGFDTNSQNGDNPAPQNGACPGNKISPITHTHSCWVFMDNFVHDNNNPNAPGAGLAAEGPVGTGMSISGGRNDTIMHNRFVHNNAWGAILIGFIDDPKPCFGGTKDNPLVGTGTCYWDDYGIHVVNNTFTKNGGYGNPTNGQFDELNLERHPSDCYSGNVDTGGSLSPDAAKLQQQHPTCTTTPVDANLNIPFLDEVLCDTGVKLTGFGCQPGDHYPRKTRVVMHPLPRHLKTMPNPCQGVPANPWCPGRRH
jgi:hypothetical protein